MITRCVLALIGMLVLAPAVLVRNKCGDVDEVASCRKICEHKLPGKRIYHSEVVGTTGDDGHRTCACYPERYVVVYDPGDEPKPEQPAPMRPERESQ